MPSSSRIRDTSSSASNARNQTKPARRCGFPSRTQVSGCQKTSSARFLRSLFRPTAPLHGVTAARAWAWLSRNNWWSGWEARSASRARLAAAQDFGSRFSCPSRPWHDLVPSRKVMPVRRLPFVALLAAIFCARAAAQEADAGFTMPVTITGGALYTHRLTADDPDGRPYGGAFHAVLNPGLKLGPHWFVYSSIHVRSTPFF